MADQGVQRRSKRIRRASEVATDAGSSGEQASASTAQRPTPAELQEALEVIQMMKERNLCYCLLKDQIFTMFLRQNGQI